MNTTKILFFFFETKLLSIVGKIVMNKVRIYGRLQSEKKMQKIRIIWICKCIECKCKCKKCKVLSCENKLRFFNSALRKLDEDPHSDNCNFILIRRKIL